jgi:hypothetical protein
MRAELEASLFVVFFLVELGRVAETKNLAAGVARQDAVGPFRLERDDRHVPRARPKGRGHAPTREPLERFELEDCRRRLDVIERPSRNCHTAPPVAGRMCNLDASYLG